MTSPLPDGLPVPTDEELAFWRAEADKQNALIAEEDRLRAQREAILATPIVALPITGLTVEQVKQSAEASVQDLAQQMETKLQALAGNA